jgi:IMP dehydrogenase/acetoin utilization protein AcuB
MARNRAMNVSDIMTAKPATILQDDSLDAALELMDQVGCHHLPVLSSDGHLVGILSDRDCRKALNLPLIRRDHWKDHGMTEQTSIRSLMSPAPIVVEPSAPAEEAVRLMLVNRIGSLPVMRSETLIGIVTKSDILLAFMRLSQNPL